MVNLLLAHSPTHLPPKTTNTFQTPVFQCYSDVLYAASVNQNVACLQDVFSQQMQRHKISPFFVLSSISETFPNFIECPFASLDITVPPEQVSNVQQRCKLYGFSSTIVTACN
jgi:hypothetical protein